MSSVNSFLSSTAYHASNARYASSSSNSVTGSSFNIRSANVQQPLNDLNSTRSSNSSCSTSHCLSNQCLECTTVLSTRPFQSRCHLTNHVDSNSNESHFGSNCTYLSNAPLDHHSSISTNDELSSTRILSMNIPVDNSNYDRPLMASTLNIEIREEDDDDADAHRRLDQENSVDHQRTDLFQLNPEDNERLEVFVGFYRPGEYQRETIDDDDDETSVNSGSSEVDKKDEQTIRQLINDNDEANEDQDFIDADFGPNQDEETEPSINPIQPSILDDNEIIQEEELLVLNSNLPAFDPHEGNGLAAHVLVEIDEDDEEDQGFGAQFNDDCASTDDENNHASNLSSNPSIEDLNEPKKLFHQRCRSDFQLNRTNIQRYFSLPNLSSIDSRTSFEKIEHIIIDDQQPATTMSNVLIKKKSFDEVDQNFVQKKKSSRKLSEEILENSPQENVSSLTVTDSVRDVERHMMIWSDEHARQIDGQSSIEQIVQYFQLDLNIIDQQENDSNLSLQRESLLDYLQRRSENDVSAAQLEKKLFKHEEFSGKIHCRFFAFWPPRDVDLLQWLSEWLKQNALPVAMMNIDHSQSNRYSMKSNDCSWQHRIIYSLKPRAIQLSNPIQTYSPQQLYEQLTVDSITYVARQEIIQRYNYSPIALTPLAKAQNSSALFSDTRWRTMNVLGQVINVLREDRQSEENETRNIPYRPTVTHVRIPSTCSSGILIFSKDFNLLMNAIDLPLRL